MKSFFVTGGSGFIGSAFIKIVLRHLTDCRIVNFDALKHTPNLNDLRDIKDPRYQFMRGDITNRAAVNQAMSQGFDAVINFAEETPQEHLNLSADRFLRTNVIGTQILLKAAYRYKISRFVHISTDKVLGSLPDDDDAFFTETSPYAPNSPYASSKAASEHLVRSAQKTFNLDTIITRCGNTYGAGQFSEKLIPRIILNAMLELPISLYGDGRNVRDWIHVEDYCRGLLSVLLRGKSGEVYNFGARTERRNLEVAISILNLLRKPYSLINFVKDRHGNDRRCATDATKAENELNWKPLVKWESGLEQTVDWYLKNNDWVSRIKSNQNVLEFYKSAKNNYPLFGLEKPSIDSKPPDQNLFLS